MGEPNTSNVVLSMGEYISHRSETCGSDTSQYAEEKKSRRDSHSSGERSGKSPNHRRDPDGVVGSDI